MNILIFILGIIVTFKFIQNLFKIDATKKETITMRKCYIYGFLCAIFYIWLFISYPDILKINFRAMML